MNAFARGLDLAFPDKLRSTVSTLLRKPAKPLAGVALKPRCKCVGLITTAALLQVHSWAVVAKPHTADGVIDICIGLALFLSAWVFYLYGKATTGPATLRWYIFSASLSVGGLNYLRSALETFHGPHLPLVNNVLHGLAGVLTILALTLPSASRSSLERAVDIIVALCLCGFRIAYLLSPVVTSEVTSRAVARFTFESALVLIIALVALLASSKADLPFFKAVVVFRVATFVGGLCANQIGVLLFHQNFASPWSFASTVLRLAAALYLLKGLDTHVNIPVTTSQRAVISSLVPLTMSCLLVWLSVLLLPAHPHFGYFGIIVGIGGFLARTALSALSTQHKEALRTLEPPSSSVPSLDPLNTIETRAGLQRALANAAISVSRQQPLSLILFNVENVTPSVEVTSPAQDEDNLIAIGRSLSQWTVSGSSLCYMGNARFALVLPSTSYTVACSLADHIALSLEAIRLPGQEGPIVVSSGAAEASQPSQVSELLGIATNALIRALIRDNNRRPGQLVTAVASDC